MIAQPDFHPQLHNRNSNSRIMLFINAVTMISHALRSWVIGCWGADVPLRPLSWLANLMSITVFAEDFRKT